MATNGKSAPVSKPTAAKWSLSGPDFTGPREDVIATIQGMQSIPPEWSAAAIAAINGLEASVRGIRLNLYFHGTPTEFHINGRCAALY